MAYNFKSIADVEVVAEPSESANVLIEEDGVIKKAPKTAVGGAGNNAEYDLDIEVQQDEDGDLTWSVNVISSYSALRDKILSGNKPTSRVKLTGHTWAGTTFYTEVFESLSVYYQPQDDAGERGEGVRFVGSGACERDIYVLISPDGEIYVILQ